MSVVIIVQFSYKELIFMNRRDRGILYGMAIGDGCVICKKRLKDGKYPYIQSEIRIGHSIKQIEYIAHKAKLLHQIFGGNLPSITKFEHFLPSIGKSYQQCRIVKSNNYFRQMHSDIYPYGKKEYTVSNLSKLTDEGIAIWYMDDGSIGRNYNKDNFVTSVSTRIHICCSYEEAILIQKFFKEQYGIDARVMKEKQFFSI